MKASLSARMLDGPLSGLEEAVQKKDELVFQERFSALTTTCNACHALESVAFVTVAPPERRGSVVRPAEMGR